MGTDHVLQHMHRLRSQAEPQMEITERKDFICITAATMSSRQGQTPHVRVLPLNVRKHGR
jgi:hypothetical protein